MSDKKTDWIYQLVFLGNIARRIAYLDDASTSPHGGNTSVVQLPVVDLGSLSHEHETLSIRDDLGSVKGLLEIATESAET